MIMKIKYLYTVILDYNGGTYVSQILCESIEDVLEKWLDNFDFNYISKKPNIKEKFKKEIVCYGKPNLLNGLINVWYISILIKKKSGSFHIILTQV